MAAILRSSKFLRCFTGLTKYVVKIPHKPEITLCSQFQQNFSSTTAAKVDVNLEKQLRRLDQDVRRIGRITRREIEEVLEEIRSNRSATSSQSLLMIRCCGNLVPEEMPEVRTALVKEIWKTLNSLNIPMDISHYNALLRVYLENEHSFSPTEVLAELQSKNIEPNRVTYQRLIARYCQQGDIEGATRILEFMREKGLPVNENVFNSLILGHSQANDLESARSILTVMKQAGLEPTVDTYATLLCCYARYGNIEDILKTLESCEKNEIYLLDRDLFDIVYALTINGYQKDVDNILCKLRFSTGFNQDAVNIILRLINKGYEDVGLKILRIMPRSTRADGQLVDAGSFLIKQMVKANRPLNNILNVCTTLQNEGLNTKALLVATEAGLVNGSVHNTIPLLKEMKNNGLPIRQHYFWPLICAIEPDKVLDIIKCMQNEFSLSPNFETVRDYVIPNLKEKKLDKIVAKLRDAGVTNYIATSSAAYFALLENQIEYAASIMESNKAYYAPQLYKQPLITALDKTRNYSAFIRIIRQIYENVKSRQASANVENSEQLEHCISETGVGEESLSSINNNVPDIIGPILLESCIHFRHNAIEILEKVLFSLVKEGLSMSNKYATLISDRLGESMTPQLSELLGKLSSGDLEPIPLKTVSKQKRGIDSMTTEEIERFIVNVEAKGENANNLKRHLLSACFRSKNLDKTLDVIHRLEAEKFSISTGVWAQLIDLYTYHSKSEDALKLYEKIKKENHEFLLDNFKTIRLVDLLLKEERFDDAIDLLKKNKSSQRINDHENSFNYTMTVWRCLNFLAEAGDTQKLESLVETLVEGGYILPNNILLGPLIKVHLVKDDIQKAMETFEHICGKYKCTPWKNELACRLIQMEDATNLQKLTDLSTNIHGEVNSLYDLVFSFVECGRIRQARKILETPGLRTRPHRIDNACERYKNEGMVEPLEGLVEATKDLHHIDRSKIYHSLLLSYCKTDDAHKALGLWTKMQEENITPTDTFLIKLAELLEKSNIKVPFVTPQNTPYKNNKIELNVPNEENNSVGPTRTNALNANDKTKLHNQSKVLQYRKAINIGDIDTAMHCKNVLKPNESFNVIDISNLIELLVRKERLTEANKCVNELLDKKQYPLPRIFKYFLNKIAAAGDIDTLETIGNRITNEQKKLISFDNRLCHGYIAAGKVQQYLNRLDKQISEASTVEDVAKLSEEFPRGGALGILDRHPEIKEDFEKLAEKYAAKNQLGPMNVLWMHLISKGDEYASKLIWEKHLSNAPRLMFQRVLQTAREHNDSKLAESVINQLRGSNISEGAIGNAYSCLIDIFLKNNNCDKALEALQAAVKDVKLEAINRSALQRLKNALNEKGKEFPYTIPEKKPKNELSSYSSTSSSSDDDVTPKRPETRPMKPEQRP